MTDGVDSAGPLAGHSVIVGRAAVDSASLAARLRELGAEPILIPLVKRVAPTDRGAALHAAIDDLGSYRWLAFTSANGVRSVAAALGSRSLPPELAVAAVGSATAAAAEAVGFTVSLISSTATAKDLAATFLPLSAGSVDERRPLVLAPLAELASSDLEAGLEAQGYRVARVDAYRMEPTTVTQEQRQAAARADAVLFTAPSLIDLYLDAMTLASIPPVVVCIGPRTAARAIERNIAGAVVAAEHDEGGLIRALLAALRPTPTRGL